MSTRIIAPQNLGVWCAEKRARGQKIVATNGCFDVLHAGHVALLQEARALGDCLLVLLNSDESVRRLKGETRPINDESARAYVLSALACVDGVCIFSDDTPLRVLEIARPDFHVKGGDYRAGDLPETPIVRKNGGEIVIVPLRDGFSTTRTLQKIAGENASSQDSSAAGIAAKNDVLPTTNFTDANRNYSRSNSPSENLNSAVQTATNGVFSHAGNMNAERANTESSNVESTHAKNVSVESFNKKNANREIRQRENEKVEIANAENANAEIAARCIVVIPARYGASRFPGKPLANLGGRSVIEHVVERALETKADRPILVATDDERIARVVSGAFDAENVRVVMTRVDCETGTDRIAEAVIEYSKQAAISTNERLIVVNVQGDEPFVNAAHLDQLIAEMRVHPQIQMATLATPIFDAAQIADNNVVKVVRDLKGDALYFSRFPLPFARDENSGSSTRNRRLRHLGVYAYDAQWLQQMAKLPPSPLEQSEKLEQLRALENGVHIRVLEAENVVNIAIDTPQDLIAAQQYLKGN